MLGQRGAADPGGDGDPAERGRCHRRARPGGRAHAGRGRRSSSWSIQDDGPGIPPDVLPKVFEPFYTTKGPSRGTGLGLAICYGIVADHQGRLDVRSEPGRGSLFRMALPIAREDRTP
ncbi:MAG: ATP-binding protein [Gemmatimonadales bacterium]